MHNLQEIGKGLTLYSGDFGDYYPTVRLPGGESRPMASLSLLYSKYVSRAKIFCCPSTTDRCDDLQPGQTFLAHNSNTLGEPAKIFCCPSTTDRCDDLRPGQTFRPHNSNTQGEPRRECSYAYDDTRGPNPSKDIVIAGDAPPRDLGLKNATSKTNRNSDNHQGQGQLILLAGGDIVIWIPRTENPMIAADDIYTAADPANPGASDSYIHQ